MANTAWIVAAHNAFQQLLEAATKYELVQAEFADWKRLNQEAGGKVKCQATQDLPTIEEMSGLVDDFTGGKSLKDFMEEMRG